MDDIIWCEAICFNFPDEDKNGQEGWLCRYKATSECIGPEGLADPSCFRPVCNHHRSFQCCDSTAEEHRADAEARGRQYLMQRVEMAAMFRRVYGDGVPDDASFKFLLSPSGGCLMGTYVQGDGAGLRSLWLNFRVDGKVEKGIFVNDAWMTGDVVA